MIFKAIPVNVGDCFLLENEGLRILVDGGVGALEAVELLNKESIPDKHIDVLICTHYDSDHINGILGILKSKEYTFKELWLPEILGSIGYSINKNILIELVKLRGADNAEFKYVDLPVNYDCNSCEVEEINYNQMDDIVKFFTAYPRYRWDFFEENQLILISNIKSITSLMTKSYYSGSHIRWFNFENQLLNDKINFNLSAKNCKQTGLTQYTPDQLLKALVKISLSRINKESLVFQYNKDGFPDVLFTADSDLSFCKNNKIILKANSIVTAPHHGSSSNDKAYKLISGENVIYVRSDSYQIKRPGTGYTGQNEKYCTVCRNLTQKTKVELVYNNGKYLTNNVSCCC